MSDPNPTPNPTPTPNPNPNQVLAAWEHVNIQYLTEDLGVPKRKIPYWSGEVSSSRGSNSPWLNPNPNPNSNPNC